MKLIAVHDRSFHADDVFAVSILKLVYPDARVIRTRDERKIREANIRVDVGRKYLPKSGYFDHHQPEGAGERKNGIPYASAGLIWKHYGRRLTKLEEIFDHIDDTIIQYVDANDVGMDTHKVTLVKPYTIADFIKGLNPPWKRKSDQLYNKYFNNSVSVISTLLKREIESAEYLIEGRVKLRKLIKHSVGEYLILRDYIPWEETLVEESKLKFVVYPNSLNQTWCVSSVPISLNSFKNRRNMPKTWAGLAEKDFQRVSGVKDAKFCHNNQGFAIAKSRKGAITLVELSLKN